MDLVAFEYDRSFILEALRRGEIDYLEHVGEALEGDFFRQLIDRQVPHVMWYFFLDFVTFLMYHSGSQWG